MHKIVACLHNHCCYRNVALSSLHTVTDLQVAVNNIKPLSVSTEMQDTTVKLQNIL
jgi:hypothetical protein